MYRNLRNTQFNVLFLGINTTRTTLPYVTLESRYQANELADMQFPTHHLISLNHLTNCTFWVFFPPPGAMFHHYCINQQTESAVKIWKHRRK